MILTNIANHQYCILLEKMVDGMYNIPTILTSDELLDKVFHKASKKSEDPKIKNKIARQKKVVLTKIAIITDSLDSTLNNYIAKFPSFDQVHRFEYELIDIIISIDKIRKSLGTIDWARKQIRQLQSSISKKIGRINSRSEYNKVEELRRTFYGRATSIIKQVSSDLLFLNSVRNKLRQLPTIDPNLMTVVVAGFPNVGKSQLVKQISSAEPEIAKYPFTTKELNIGHLSFKYQKIQVIDTPGLLDRSPKERNSIERQAIMALKYLANLIIFIIDPTEHCGYSVSDQQKLLAEIKSLYETVDMLVIENKSDIRIFDTDILKISAKNGDGLDLLMENIKIHLLADLDKNKDELNIEPVFH